VTAAARIRSSIRFRGRSFLALVLAPALPLDEWLRELDMLAGRSPGFFAGRPVVLEITGLKLDAEDVAALLENLSGRGIRVMAVEGAAPGLLDARFPPPISGGRDARPIETEPTDADRPSGPRPMHTLILEHPVRSGQTVMHPAGDVIVLGAVSSGAEVIAGGSIHVYGALRGRAIAGTTGHAGARIFCRKLEAELLAIDGLYCTADTMDANLRGRAAQAWLEGDAMLMTALE
jgi:septum site-determining protein MinC